MTKYKISNDWWTTPTESLNGHRVIVTGRRGLEKAISSGEEVDLKEFLKYEEKDFSNGFSDFGVDISSFIDKGCGFIFGYIIKIFELLFK